MEERSWYRPNHVNYGSGILQYTVGVVQNHLTKLMHKYGKIG